MKSDKIPKEATLLEKSKHILSKRREFTTTQMIVYGFLIAILAGSILLSLPFASAEGTWTPYLDALFTATTSTCVTGLVTVPTFSHWSIFGKIVIVILIQFGGLGIVTFTTTIFLALRKRITLKERLVIQDAYNLDTLKGLVKLTIKIMKGTFLIEGIGAIFYAIQFVPQFGLFEGIGKAIFNSISAFCNAGMDIVANDSLAQYISNPLMNITTMLLIIIGGIGFPVWWDIVGLVRLRLKEKMSIKALLRKMELHTKLVLTMTIVLIVTGAIAIFIIEYNNPQSIGTLGLGDKVMASTFQSVTTRTAGFQTIPQENFKTSSNLLFLILMFIGGSPSGTAGGIKTVTVAVMILSVWATIRGKQDVEAYNRKITDTLVKKSMAVFGVSFAVLLCSTFALSVTETGSFMDIMFETTSAIGTVGLTRGFTASLSEIGKIIIIITMYLGRIGPITLALAFNTHKKEKSNARKLPTDKIMVG